MTVGQGHELKYAVVNTASSGANTIVAAVTGKRIKVVSYVLIAVTAVTVEWRSGTSANSIMGAASLGATGGVAALGDPTTPLFECASGALLGLQLGGAVQVSGHVCYIVEAD